MARTRRVTEIEEDFQEPEELDGTKFEDHPLFPRGEGEKPFEVAYIQVTRSEEGVQKYAGNFSAKELQSEQDIMDRFGGGYYQIASRKSVRDGIPGPFTKHRKLFLPGALKPLSATPSNAERNLAGLPVETRTVQAVATAPAAPAQTMGDMAQLFGLMMQMNQSAADRAAQSQQAMMTMFMGMMQNGKAESQAMTQMMLEMSSRGQASMTQLITAIMANRGGGPEEMAKYADLLKSLGFGTNGQPLKKEGGDSLGEMVANAADIIQGMVQLKGSSPAMMPAGETPSTPPQPIGGATSLLYGRR